MYEVLRSTRYNSTTTKFHTIIHSSNTYHLTNFNFYTEKIEKIQYNDNTPP